MKNQPLTRRFGFALAGLISAFRSELSIKTEVAAAIATVAVLVWQEPGPLWWAVVIVVMALIFAAELANTAIEHLADLLHPGQHPQIKIVKDCAAAAVLVASTAAIGVAVALVVALWAR